MTKPTAGPTTGATTCTSTLSVTEAARRFSDVINRTRYRRERFVLTKGGAPVAEIRPLVGTGGVTAREVAAALAGLPRLGAAEAERFEHDLAAARRSIAPLEAAPWD
jgi:antitoxin (DNA-binding transcriptional repressor) of toxin-antitoxin stability system